MTTRLYTEVTCDGCGQADFAMHKKKGEKQLVSTTTQMRRNGWIVARGGKHFCGKRCKALFISSTKT